MEGTSDATLISELRGMSIAELIRKEVVEAIQSMYKDTNLVAPVVNMASGTAGVADGSERVPESRVSAKSSSEQVVFDEYKGRDVKQLLRDLKGPVDGFDPRTECEFDDVSELWQKQAKGFGYDPELLKYAIMRIGSRRIQDVIEETGAIEMDLQGFFDTLSKELYPFSRQLESLEQSLEATDRQHDVTACIEEFMRRIERHSNLCRRWGVPNGFHQKKLKECLMKKLPLEAVDQLLLTDWRSIDFRSFIKDCRRIYDSLQRRQDSRTAELLSASRQGSHEPHIAEVMPTYQGNGQDYRCYNCGKKGHRVRDCAEPRVRCTTCGRGLVIKLKTVSF